MLNRSIPVLPSWQHNFEDASGRLRYNQLNHSYPQGDMQTFPDGWRRTVSDQFCARLFRALLLLIGLIPPLAVLATQAHASVRFIGPGRPLMCVNVFQPFGFGASTIQSGSPKYEVDPFQNGGSDLEVMPDERLRGMRSANFDCVRMVIDVAALMAAPDDAALNRLVAQLIAGMTRRVNLGLKVIADIHPLPKGVHPVPGLSDVEIIDGPHGPKFQRLVQVVARLAGALKKAFRPSDVALELFNEPPEPGAFADRRPWNTQIEDYWQQIRKVLPDHTLIVAGMGLAEIDGTDSGVSSSGIVNLRPWKFDDNTGFAFHAYEPALFTQQDTPGFFSHVHGLTFPAASHPGGQTKAEQDFEASVKADASLSPSGKRGLIRDFVDAKRHSYSFARYWLDFGSRDALARRLGVVTAWADANHLDRRQIMDTEFGVARNHDGCSAAAPDASAAEFIRSTVAISVAARLGVVTIHEAQGSCFAISTSRAPFRFDPLILEALGLQ